LAGGRGKDRGSTQGLQKTGSWNTVLISSGEGPITSFTKDGGAVARVLQIWGSPWGRTNSETGLLVNQIDAAIKSNYGLAGSCFVIYLLANWDKWLEWRKVYLEFQSRYQNLAGSSNVAYRIAEYFAVVHMAALVANQALCLPWGYHLAKDALDSIWEDLILETKGADRSKEALDYVVSWAQSNSKEFYPRCGDRLPYKGMAGKWKDGEDWDQVGLFRHRLEELLKTHGFDCEAVLRTWRDRGWLRTDSEIGKDRFTKRERIAGESPRLVCIKREAIEMLNDGEQAQESP
jgi:putative DNA primase/helicase